MICDLTVRLVKVAYNMIFYCQMTLRQSQKIYKYLPFQPSSNMLPTPSGNNKATTTRKIKSTRIQSYTMKLTITSLLALSALPVFAAATCEADSTGKFIVNETAGNEKRSCEWAAREDTENRCAIRQIAWQCETTCGCDETLVVDDTPVISAAVSAPEGGDTVPKTLIVSLSLAGVALIALLGLVAVKMKIKREVSDDDSLGLNDNSVVLSMNDDDVESPVTRQESDLADISVATEMVQKGSFDSCCAPC